MKATLDSMTGYARAQGELDGTGWAWEIKSVNGRGLEVRCRLPGGFDQVELPARDLVQKRLARGSVNLTLTVQKGSGGPARLAFNEAMFAGYVELVRTWREKLPDFDPPRIDALLSARGVLEQAAEAEPEMDKLAPAVLAGLSQALESLAAMRAAEGQRLAGLLTTQLDGIAGLVQRGADHPALHANGARDRLRAQLALLLDAVPSLSEERIAQEAALLAVKGDAREELDRLTAHVAAARDLIASGEAVGRRLDFLCQEFNREANTFCAKAADLELTRIGLDLKARIEQFREQVQNVE